MKNTPLAFCSIWIAEVGRPFLGLQPSSSSRSCSRTLAVFGRTDGKSVGSNSSSHVWVNNVHNASENPTAGLSGRSPSKTLFTTASSLLVFSKGFRPVITYEGEVTLCSRGGEAIRASRIVIPRAYTSVLFDGSFLRARLTYPYRSGSMISGAIHRIVPPALWLLDPSRELASAIAASPKSAKQARHSELMRTLAWMPRYVTGQTCFTP